MNRFLLAMVLAVTASCGVADLELAHPDDALASSTGALTVSAAPMSVARYQHAAVRLPDGRVMAIGGYNVQASALASTELYDPATNTWSPGPDLGTARRFHSAVVLDDGQVLVMGGISAVSGVLATAELCDATQCSPTGSMALPRYMHFPIKLADGRVLLAGGPGYPTLAEIYDPATGTFSSAGSTAIGRVNPGLVELFDGRVLLVGGAITQTSCELWDPATNSFSPAASTAVGRNNDSLVLTRLPDTRLLVAGGNSRVAELYDPATFQWTATGSLAAVHNGGFGTVLEEGSVVFGGGRELNASNGLERYDSASGTWSVQDQLTSERSSAIGVPLTGTSALFVGGYILSGGSSGTPVAVANVDRLQPPACAPTLSPVSVNFENGGGSDSITVDLPHFCTWSLHGAPAWLTVTSGSSGVGYGFIEYTVSPNGGAARTATLSVNGVSFTLSQDASPCGAASISPSSASFPSAGGTGSVSVTTGEGCPWSVVSVPAWVTVTSGSSGSGPATVTYAVAPNGGSARSATLSIAGLPFAVSQATAPSGYASYNATWRAPACTTPMAICDTGTLVNGRAALGPEAHAPNTLQSTCVDGTAGTYHVDESVDRIKISTVDGTPFAVGKTVNVDVTVWAYSAYTTDKLDIFTSPSLAGGSWSLRTTLTPAGAGAQTMRYTFVLTAAGTQSVRAQFRYFGTASPCMVDSYNDRDDLVIAVAP